jgi:membrane fusion protein (multidrug efflux system)
MTLSKSAIAALLLAVLIFAGTAYALVGAASARGTDNAYVRGDVTAVSSKVSGVIAEVRIADNQEVRAGDILFRLDDRDYRARVDQARAALSARRAAILRLDRSLELQQSAIGEARAAVRGAGAEAERSRRELTRIRVLRGEGWVTKSRSDEASASSEKALAGVAGAEAALDASHDQYDVISSQRQQLVADVEAARAELRLAKLDLESTIVRAPSNGRVAERQARKGQYVRPGTPLIALVSPNVWIVANFKETEIRGMRAGEPVSIVVDSQPGRVFAGRVDSLSPASGAQFALLPPDNATGNFTRIVQRIPIRIAVPPGQPGLEDLRPGMSARIRRADRGPNSLKSLIAGAGRRA